MTILSFCELIELLIHISMNEEFIIDYRFFPGYDTEIKLCECDVKAKCSFSKAAEMDLING